MTTGSNSGNKNGKKRRELQRGISNDDMLDTTGKLHKQPSGKRSLQQQRTQKQLGNVGAMMDIYTSSTHLRIRPYEEDEKTENDDLPKIKPRNSSSIDKSASAESHSITLTSSSSIKGLTPKQPSSANLLPAVSRKGGSMTSTSPYAPLARGPSGTRLQPLVQPKGVTAAAAQRKLLRKYSSDDMLR